MALRQRQQQLVRQPALVQGGGEEEEGRQRWVT